jgi:hypothetical protein
VTARRRGGCKAAGWAALDLDAVIAALTAGSPASTIARELAETILPGRLDPAEPVVGLGWATVDTERTVTEATGVRWEPPTREAALGASASVSRIGDAALVVLEPDTEARLAASLARFGEGLCVAYVVDAGGPGGMVRPTALAVPGRLRAHARPWGPYLIALQAWPLALTEARNGPPR